MKTIIVSLFVLFVCFSGAKAQDCSQVTLNTCENSNLLLYKKQTKDAISIIIVKEQPIQEDSVSFLGNGFLKNGKMYTAKHVLADLTAVDFKKMDNDVAYSLFAVEEGLKNDTFVPDSSDIDGFVTGWQFFDTFFLKSCIRGKIHRINEEDIRNNLFNAEDLGKFTMKIPSKVNIKGMSGAPLRLKDENGLIIGLLEGTYCPNNTYAEKYILFEPILE